MNRIKISKQFDKKYFDKNTASGLNEKDFKNFIEMVKDQKQHLSTTIESVIKELVGEKFGKDIKKPTRVISFWKDGYNKKRQEIINKAKEMGFKI